MQNNYFTLCHRSIPETGVSWQLGINKSKANKEIEDEDLDEMDDDEDDVLRSSK